MRGLSQGSPFFLNKLTMDSILHAIGLCGDHAHFNLIDYVFMGAPRFSYILTYANYIARTLLNI
jgi:hypothetical protein